MLGSPGKGRDGLHFRSHANEGNDTEKVGGSFACREQHWLGNDRDLKSSCAQAGETPGKIRADGHNSLERPCT